MQVDQPKASPARVGQTAKILVSLMVVAALIGLLVYEKGISLGEVAAVIGRFGWRCAAIVFALDFLQGVLNILRIYGLFPRQVRPRLSRVAYGISVGQLANTFLPARAGDLLKAVIFGRDPGQPELSVMTGAGVIIGDKAVDFTAFVLIIFLSGAYRMPGVHFPSLLAVNGWGGALSLVAALLFAALLFCGVWILRERLRALFRWFRDFRRGLAGLLQPMGLVTGLMTGLGVWAAESMALKTLAQYQGFSLGIAQAIFVLCILNLAIAVPVSVANVGTFEASIVFGLTTAGIELPVAVAIAATHHVLQWLAVTALALIMIAWKRWGPIPIKRAG